MGQQCMGLLLPPKETTKMKNRKLRLTLALLLGLSLLAGFAGCRPWKHKSPEERAEWLVKRINKELDLNDSQKQTLQRIKEELIAKHNAEKPQIQQQFSELNQLIRAETLDQAKLKELRKRHQAHREAMEALFVEKVVEFHKVLSAEQRNKAADLMQKHMKRFMGEK